MRKGARGKKKPVAEKNTADYRHAESKRSNIPEAGLQSFDRKVPKRVRYEYDPHLDPQLVWASKAERSAFDVDTVSLHIHERISTQAIVQVLKRSAAQRELFADPALPLDRAVQFYQHPVGWMNRLVLGDSLLVMNSLVHREMLAGKVQMIYMDPPYGVAYNSNFQSRADKREVKDGEDQSLTREPEQIKAYRDTWTLGVHSYLSYLRDRLVIAREMLAESGSLFVQIGDANVHRVRDVLDEIFGASNFVSQIAYAKTTGATGWGLPNTVDYVLWYARNIEAVKFRTLYFRKLRGGEGAERYDQVELPDGTRRSATPEERADPQLLPEGSKLFTLGDLTSQSIGREKGEGAACWFPVRIGGRDYLPSEQVRWKTNERGMQRLLAARRVQPAGNRLRYVRYLDDFPAYPVTNLWDDIGGVQSRSDPKIYVVQTSTTAIARCLLMTTDPGDIVLDPTCGSGTTAYVAEQWGRRWITCDTSRVAVALARQRLMTGTFPYYKLAHPNQGVAAGFVYEEVPHVTLKSIAQDLPAEKEKLYDKPHVDPNVVRVTGPFTVEAINTLDPGEALAFEPIEEKARKDDISHRGKNGGTVNAHIEQMIDLLKRDGGVNVPGKGRVEIEDLGINASRPGLHADGRVKLDGKPRRLAAVFGPRYGPVTARLVEEAVQASVGSYDALVVAGFSFDPEVSAFLEKSPPAGIRLFRVQIAPDVLIGDLLKTSHRQNLFAVMGEPDFKLDKTKEGFVVELKGVDIYDPNRNEVLPSALEDIAAWFIDHDYDGRCFCVCQVFLPVEKGKGFEKLQRALKGVVDEDAWETLSGFRSRPFQPGDHKRIALKVIDVRGNEVVGVRKVGRESGR